MKMVQGTKLLLIALFLSIFSSTGFSGGFNFGSGHFGNRQIIPFHHNYKYSTKSSYSHIPKHILKFHNPSKHRKNPYRFIYNPRYFYYGGNQSEKIGNVEVNVNIIGDEKGESNKSSVKKENPIPLPHIVTLPDIAPAESDKHLKSAKTPESVILIHGTKVSETRIASD